MSSTTKFYHVPQIILYMWSFGQSLVKFGIFMKEIFAVTILYKFDQKQNSFDGCSWFKFNNLGLALDMVLKFYISVAKGLKLKVRKFLRLITMFVEVTERNW